RAGASESEVDVSCPADLRARDPDFTPDRVVAGGQSFGLIRLNTYRVLSASFGGLKSVGRVFWSFSATQIISVSPSISYMPTTEANDPMLGAAGSARGSPVNGMGFSQIGRSPTSRMCLPSGRNSHRRSSTSGYSLPATVTVWTAQRP